MLLQIRCALLPLALYLAYYTVVVNGAAHDEICTISGSDDNCDDANQVCVDDGGTLKCTCDPGFAYEETECKDIDECGAMPSPCDVNANCANSDTPSEAPTCTCKAGWTGTSAAGAAGTPCTVPGNSAGKTGLTVNVLLATLVVTFLQKHF